MFSYLNRCSQGRGAWLLLAASAIIFELCALYFQHVMLLAPCVLCIYERCAIFGVLIAALLGAAAPSTPLRYVAILLWIYSSVEGLKLAYKHTMIQLQPSPFMTCDFFVTFPSWMPLNKWLPAVFEASGDCALKQWSFLSLEMPQWLIVIFVAYLMVAALVMASQFVSHKR